MKRISCSLASIILLSNVGAFVAYADFSDVPDSYPNSTAISYVQSHGIVKGYDDGTYRPDSLINRAEFTKIIVAGTTTEAQRSECKFNENLLTVAPRDVDITAWYAPYVCMALLDEIVRGYPDGTFQPDQNINVVEAAKIMALAFRLETASTPPNATWFTVYIKALAVNRAIPLSIRNFEAPVTRGEMAEMVYRIKAAVTNKPSHNYATLEQDISPVITTSSSPFGSVTGFSSSSAQGNVGTVRETVLTEFTEIPVPDGGRVTPRLVIDGAGNNVAYIEKTSKGENVILNSKTFGSYGAVDFLTLSDNKGHLGFITYESGGGNTVDIAIVVDGAVHAYGSLDRLDYAQNADFNPNISFSPDGDHYSYSIARKQTEQEWLDTLAPACRESMEQAKECLAISGTSYEELPIVWKNTIIIDGIERDTYDEVSKVFFSTDGKHTAYVALKGQTRNLYVDDMPRALTHGCGKNIQYNFQTDALLCNMHKSNRSILYKDGKHQDISLSEYAYLGPDGSSLASINREQSGKRITFKDDTFTIPNSFGDVRPPLVINNNGTNIAYGVVLNEHASDGLRLLQGIFVENDGMGTRIGGKYLSAGHPVFDITGKFVAFIATGERGTFVVYNGQEGPVYKEGIATPPRFNESGTTIEYAALRGKTLLWIEQPI